MIIILLITLCNPKKKVIQVVKATSEDDSTVKKLRENGYIETIGIFEIPDTDMKY